VLDLSLSGFDPGCVKSRKFNLELPSLFRRFENEQCKQLPSREDNKENDSTLFLPMRLFTQAGPRADMRQVEISQCSGLLLRGDVLLFGSSTEEAAAPPP
jgi:hypothetical protein